MTDFTPASFDVIHTAPAWMPEYERVVLYGLIVGLRPRLVLEIGTFQGGSTAVMTAALDDIGDGRILCVDPDPRVAEETWQGIEHRATMIAKGSPDGVIDAAAVAGGPFEFALIDGDHTFDGVITDIEATLPTLADEAHILFHDAHFGDVRDAIDDALVRHGAELTDSGLVSRANTLDENGVAWGGLRLLRYQRASPPAPSAQRQNGASASASLIVQSLPERIALGPAGSAAPRGPIRTWLRRLLLRLARPVTAYQHEINVDVHRSLKLIVQAVEQSQSRR